MQMPTISSKCFKMVQKFSLTITRQCSGAAHTSNIVSSTMNYYKDGGMSKDLTVVLDDVFSEPKFKDTPGFCDWMKNLLHYTTVGSKKIRSTVLVSSFKTLVPQPESDEIAKLSYTLGVVSEMMASHILILDDIEDGSEFRHNKPCWYRLPGVGLTATIDASLVKCLSFYIIQKYCKEHPNYVRMVELFHQGFFMTAMGQYLDNKTSQAEVTDFTQFTPERYFSITKLKSSPFCISVPFLVGVSLSGRGEDDVIGGCRHVIQMICDNIGYLYQSQNDYHDVYENKFNRKEGSDIQDRKCSWVSSTALKHCNPEQTDVFVNNYGTSDPDSVKRILDLYEELRISDLFYEDQKKVAQATAKLIDSLPDTGLRKYFKDLLNLVHNDVFYLF